MINRIRRFEKGQYSTFMKPILVMIFGMLLISLLTSTLNFNIGLEQDRQATEFQSTPIEVFSDVSSCLSVDQSVSSSNTVLNQTKLEEMDMKYKSREPECAEAFSSGYEVSVKQEYLNSLEKNRADESYDVIFVIDDTGSLGGAINSIKNSISDFIDQIGSGSRAGIITYKDSGDITIDQGFTSDKSVLENTLNSITATGGGGAREAASGGLEKAFEMFKNSGKNDNKIIILVNNAGAHNCNKLETQATRASNRDIRIYTLFSGSYCSNEFKKDLPDESGGQFFKYSDKDKILDIIGQNIGSNTIRLGGESTCTVPSTRSYNASAQIVVTSDASDNYNQEWSAICNDVNNSVRKLEAQGLDTEVSYYAPGQPASSSSGQGNPMQVSGSDYDFSTNVPSCIDTTYNSAATSSYGKGITEWNSTGLVDYNSSKDYGLEAWGVSSKWILENHNWNDSKDVRMMFVLGDQDPTGGNSTGENFRAASGTKLLDNETEVVNNVTNLSDQYNVNIYTMSDNLEYSAQDRYGDSTVNDAEELMKLAASESGGERIIYGSVNKLSERFEEQFYSLSEQGNEDAGTCKDVSYNFGDTNISDEGVEESLVSIFPVSVRQSENLTTPAEMELRLTQSPLQKVVGTINKAISNGERFNDNITVSSRITNDREITVKDAVFKRKNETTYGLRTTSGNTDIEVNDGLIIGVNGRDVFRRISSGATTIDFSNPSNQFRAYKGANLQVIALHTDQPDLKLDSLELYCVNGCSNNGQEINPNLIQASKGTTSYRELGGLGAFYHNFTSIEIGKTTDVTHKGVCYENTGDCKALRSDEVEDLTLRPGTHNLQAKYSTIGGVKFQ